MTTAPATRHLRRTPRLAPLLLRGALTGLGKRPGPEAPLPQRRLTVPGVRPEPAKVAAYARVCGFSAGGPGDAEGPPVLPLTYPHILGFPLAARLMGDRAFPLPMLGLVHTGIEIDQREALPVGGAFELTVYAEELRAHRRGTEVVMVTEARRGERLLWTDRSTYLARHRTPAPGEHPAPAFEREAPAPGGELPERARWRLPANLGRAHARVSGDYNPIHLHPLTARPLGFPRAIAHGMWTVARCAAAAVPADSGAVRLSAAFRAPVLLPGTVVYAADGGRFTVTGPPRDAAEPPRVHLTGSVRLP
ncbi:MaoC/PaaZ C-terminal domain-containing protein [Streptomyces sp. NPDC059740]|uniref:MaoC/PaaZ C-terminal domain-containing protein n=1 Tax=Streptomyces sp. NPDC059740 TaxID=3346926 RepID=UPI00365EC486